MRKNKYIGNDTVVEIPAQIEGKAVTVIKAAAFKDNTNTTSVTLPESVASIGDSALLYCENLTVYAPYEQSYYGHSYYNVTRIIQ